MPTKRPASDRARRASQILRDARAQLDGRGIVADHACAPADFRRLLSSLSVTPFFRHAPHRVRVQRLDLVPVLAFTGLRGRCSCEGSSGPGLVLCEVTSLQVVNSLQAMAHPRVVAHRCARAGGGGGGAAWSVAMGIPRRFCHRAERVSVDRVVADSLMG